MATGSHLLAFGILNLHFVVNQWLINVLEMWIDDQKLIIFWNRPWKNPLLPNRMMACFIPACRILGWNSPYHRNKPLVFLRIWLLNFRIFSSHCILVRIRIRISNFSVKGDQRFPFFAKSCQNVKKKKIWEKSFVRIFSFFPEKINNFWRNVFLKKHYPHLDSDFSLIAFLN